MGSPEMLKVQVLMIRLHENEEDLDIYTLKFPMGESKRTVPHGEFRALPSLGYINLNVFVG